MERNLVLLGWFLLAVGMRAHTQELRFVPYTTKEGLSNNDVRSLAVDSSGFLWVGTSNGLNRFDGNSFQVFTHDPGDSSSIGGNLIQGFFIDRQKRLWVGTNEGISLYHPGQQAFTNYAPDTSVLSVIGLDFQAFGQDEQGRLWVGTKNELLLLDPASGKWRSSGWARFADRVVPAQGNRLRVVVLDIQPKGKEELWVWTTFGLFSVRTATLDFRYYPENPSPVVDFDYYGSRLQYVDTRGNPWMTFFAQGIACYDTSQNAWLHFRTPDSIAATDNAAGLRSYSGDTLLYTALNNLVLFDRRTNRVVHHVRLPELSLHGTPVCRNILSTGGVWWIATDEGLIKGLPRPSLFHYRGLPDMDWIDRVYHSGSATIYASVQGIRMQKAEEASFALSLPGSRPLAAQHLYWLDLPAWGKSCFNTEDGFYVRDERSGVVSQPHWPPRRNPENELNVRNMVADRDGTVWIRTHDQGIYRYDPGTDSIRPAPDLPDGSRKMLSFLYYDSLTHALWISEEFNGVYVYDIAARRLRHYLLNTPPSQRGAGVICITGDGHGRVWLNDVVSGIICFDGVTGRFTRRTTHDGLISDNVNWNCLDQEGRLWISTDLGLSCMDTATRQFVNYYTSEGYPATGNGGGFISKDADGELFMPYRNGYYNWRPAEFAAKEPVGRLYLRGLQVSGRDAPNALRFRLAAGENNLQIRIGWLSLNGDLPPAIEYRLNEGPWLATGVSSWLSFADLPAGDYTLTARARNHPGESLGLHFSIAQPLWRNPWILASLALLIGAGLIAFNRARIGRLKKEARLKEQVMESEMATLRSQMNPHFVFNTLNSINSYIIENKTHQASDYLTDFSRLMRIILDHSRIKKVTLEEELRTVKLYLELESRRLEGGFDYCIGLEPGLDVAGVSVPPLIIQPFVENAIWHGLRHRRSAGHIEIRVGIGEEQLLITVTDNGIGRQAAARLQRSWRQNSFGTAATIRRLRLADPSSEVRIEDLYSSDGEARGTRVHLSLHLKTISYAG
jgi:ligand-binding sensor domain-containing protein